MGANNERQLLYIPSLHTDFLISERHEVFLVCLSSPGHPLSAKVDVNHHGRVDFWEFLAIQLFISLNLQDTVDLLEFIKFLNQSYTA